MQIDQPLSEPAQVTTPQPEPEDVGLAAVPLAVPENAQPETARLSKRASAAAAAAKFARNGLGSVPTLPKLANTLPQGTLLVRPKTKAKPMLPRPNTPLFPAELHKLGEKVRDEKRPFRLPAPMIRDYNPLGVRTLCFAGAR
jgi:hypothetical protein